MAAQIKSDNTDLTLNADGSGNDILFQSNGSQVGSLTAEGVFTATSFAGSGAALTGLSSFDPDGAVVFNDSSADVDFRVESNNDANAFFVDGANGNIGMGTNSPSVELEIADISSDPEVTISAWADNINTKGALNFVKSRGESHGTGGATAASENIGEILAHGYDTGNNQRAASQILFMGDAAPDGDNVAGKIIFKTNNNAGLQTALTIDDDQKATFPTDVTISDGNLVIGTSGKGIDFSATVDAGVSTPSELLDDYEEGTFTVSIQDWSDATFSMGTITAAKYTKIGNMVTIWWNGLITSTASNPSDGDVKLSGFPFSTAGGVAIHVPVMTSGTAILTYNPRFQFYGSAGYFYDHNTSGGSTPMANAFLTSTRVNLNFSYMVS